MRPRQKDINVKEFLQPETELEMSLLQEPAFLQGLFWGMPRYGHPEGKVIYHIKEVLENIDALRLSPKQRERLRLITFVHDTFKYKEDKKRNPRDWTRHHAVLARQFIEQFTSDSVTLDIIELHDEAYYCWQTKYLSKREAASDKRLANLLERLGDNRQLYYLFFKCDTTTGDKTQAPMIWFERYISDIEIVTFLK